MVMMVESYNAQLLVHVHAQLLVLFLCCCFGIIEATLIYVEVSLPPRCNSPNEADGHDDDDDDDDVLKITRAEI